MIHRRFRPYLLTISVFCLLYPAPTVSAGQVLDEGECLDGPPDIQTLGFVGEDGYSPPRLVKFRLNQPAFVSIRVVSQNDGTVYRTLANREFRGHGMHVVHWDGLDGNGAPVFYDSASFVITVTNDPNSCL